MMELLNISFPWQIQAQEETAIISWRECSKKSVQQGRSDFDARSVHGVREHGKNARASAKAGNAAGGFFQHFHDCSGSWKRNGGMSNPGWFVEKGRL